MYVTGVGDGNGQSDSSPTEIKRMQEERKLNGHHLLTSFENQIDLSIDPS